MKKPKMLIMIIAGVALTLLPGGCVERQLTINTSPPGAMVVLNDEQIGLSPVTTSFNWYGDYNVTIRKDGYQTLKTHRKLKGPWYDRFPFDFFAQVLYSKKITDTYEWSFELEPKQQPTRQELIRKADELRKQLN